MRRRTFRAAVWCSVGFWLAQAMAYAERRGGYITPIRRHHP